MGRFGNTQEWIPAVPWQQCVGKSDEQKRPGISVEAHCLDVAEVAQALLVRLSPVVRNLLGGNPPLVAGLHDVGKVSPGYLKKHFNEHVRELCPELADLTGGFEPHHARVSEGALSAYLGGEAGETLGAVVGSHHGQRDQPLSSDSGGACGGPAWATQRRGFIDHLMQRLDGPPLTDLPLNPEVLAGLVTVADWIGSDERHFPPGGRCAGFDRGQQATNALIDCGWEVPRVKPGLTFRDVFGFPPTVLQEQFIASAERPGLYVLEAPMGTGKTEAALFAAYRLMERGHHQGLYFGLPTRLTSDKIHERVLPFVKRIVGDEAGVRLAHGHAWLKAFEYGGAELRAGGAWFNPSKRSLLVPFAVGTIDQALLAVLRVKHHFVRKFGLAGKVVVLDEVHSYDIYTGTLLDALIKGLLDCRCTVIVLSATLTRARREKILTSSNSQSVAEEPYPLISRQSEGRTDSTNPPPPAPWTVAVWFIARDANKVARIAVDAARAGACVLCIADTVGEAQRWYRHVKAERLADSFEVGLLHSGFPAWRRAELEAKWISDLGKDGRRPPGCILVATQVVEQSVDIDADLIITELAPTDMLLQRLGRLWRHDRSPRPRAQPEFIIVAGEIEQANSLEELESCLGKANCIVYSAYVLWRTHQVWRGLSRLVVPNSIRSLLERTYDEPSEVMPTFARAAYEKVLERREKLRGLAEAAQVGIKGLCTMSDDERAPTRYSDYQTRSALLVKQKDATDIRARLTLSDNNMVEVDRGKVDFPTTAKLMRNVVLVPVHLLGEVHPAPFLRMHFHEHVAILKLAENGCLLCNDVDTKLSYDDELGLQRPPKSSGRLTESIIRGIGPTQGASDGGNDAWEEDLDELVW